MTGFRKVFLDTAPVIYLLQKSPLFYDSVEHILTSLRFEEANFCLSDVTIAEYCVYPYRNHRQDLINALDRFILMNNVEVLHSTTAIAKSAAQIRTDYTAFKALDALQLATAVVHGCDLFLTNDRQLRQFQGISCLTLDDWR